MVKLENAMTRPLFEEPSSDCEREDPWSGPKGFMFGGWSLPCGTTWEMAEQYYDAANLLIEGILQDQMEDYRLGTPVLFLYRHWLELAVKSIVGRAAYGHDLAKLSDNLMTLCRENGIEVPKWVIDRLHEMAHVDPSSTAFRYAENSIPGEVYVSIPNLKVSMKLLHSALGSASLNGVFPPSSAFRSLVGDVWQGE